MRWILMCLILSVVACRSEPEPGDCDPKRWGHLPGQPAEAAEEISHPKRIIPPNSAVTQDFRPERTNVDLDPSGVITRIWCG